MTRKWTPDEDAVVRRDYIHRPAKEIAEELGRTAWAVIKRARAIKPGIASEDEADAVFIGKAAIAKIGSGA